MLKRRKYLVLIISLLLVFSLSACASARKIQYSINNARTRNSHIVDGLYYDYEEKVDIYIFRTGNTYLINRIGTIDWVSSYGGAPSGLTLSDGEFAYLNADLTLVSGGIKGYINAPTVSVIHTQKNVSFAEVENSGSLAAYNPADDYIAGLKVYRDGNDTYMIGRAGYNQFCLYKNGVYSDTFSTKYDVEAALGIRDKADATADMEHFGNLNVYVIRCGDKYLMYTGNISFNEAGIWKEMLNENFENEPLDFTLQDGQAVCLQKAELMRVNGGDGGYKDAPMLLKYESMEDIRIDVLTMKTSTGHWEEGAATRQYESQRYGNGDTFIILVDGQYYVYKIKDGQNTVVGVFDSEDEVNAKLTK